MVSKTGEKEYLTHCVNTKSKAAITMVNDTNVMAKKSVNVWDDRQSFDGDLQNLIKTNFCWKRKGNGDLK